jgi:hypothetical protein
VYIVAHPDGIDMINPTADNLLWKNVLSFNPVVRAPEFITGVLAGCLFVQGRVSPRVAGRLVPPGWQCWPSWW